ncbi:glucosyltransferase domain-containing protein [Candidatus Saccharibacteria bacterium]|nr:glucosyltransferase domain-containing protein [Candidatus Saccharibacteria bacterium]
MKEKYKKFKINLKKVWRENRFLMKPFLVMLAIYLLGVSALLLAGVHYADDVARTTYGYAEWAGFSRYISTIVSHGLHGDWYLTNIAPWPQLLALVVLAFSSIAFICVVLGREIFKKKWTKWIWPIIAVVPLGLNPYMLECLSYQYDSIYMAVSILFAILPFLFWKKQNWWMFGLAIVVGILVVCMTYQASIGIFPMLVIFVAVREWSKKEIKNKEIVKFLLVTIGVFLLTVVVFQKFLMRPRDAYASNSLPEIGSFLPSLFEHLRQYFELIWGDFRMTWKVLVGIIGVIFVGLFVARSRRNRIVAFLVVSVSLILMAVATLVMYAALEKPLYAPRAMYAIGSLLALMSVYIVSGAYSKWVMKMPVLILTYCFVMFALTYGNALREQNEFRNSRVEMVLADLNKMPIMINGGEKMVQVDGEIGLSPVVRNMPIEDYRILYRLLMPSFSENIPWMAYRITEQRWLENIHYVPGVDLKEKELPLLEETMLYDIYGDKENILIKFKNEVRYDLLF